MNKHFSVRFSILEMLKGFYTKFIAHKKAKTMLAKISCFIVGQMEKEDKSSVLRKIAMLEKGILVMFW